MQRKGSAVWQGGLKNGNGILSTDSGALRDLRYSFATRFESSPGTNPEELIAAAHAACFSMALSAQLEQAGTAPKSVSTVATASLEKVADGWRVTKVHLAVEADVPGISAEEFEKAAQESKAGCPISKLLNAEISLETTLRQKAA